MLLRAVEKPPVDPLAFFYLAQAAERRAHPVIAARALLDYHTLEGDPADTRAAVAFAVRVADLLVRAGDTATAITWYERATESPDADVAVLMRLADAQMRGGAADAARVTVTRILEKDPSHAGAQNMYRRLQ
jgi:predicted Zn-dependent protease